MFPMIRLLVALALSFSPGSAEADIFTDLAGIYGVPPIMNETCNDGPQRLAFSKNNTRGELLIYSKHLRNGIETDLKLDLTIRFFVLRSTLQGIQIVIDNEEVRTESGALVEWEFRPSKDRSGFCWHRKDWPAARCDIVFQRCEEFALTS